MLAWIEGRTEITQKRMHGQTELTNIMINIHISIGGRLSSHELLPEKK